MLAKVRVGKRAAQVAMQVISTPDDYTIEDSKDAILTMMLMIPDALRIQSLACCMDQPL